MERTDIGLVLHEVEGFENIEVRRIAASLQQQGHRIRLVPIRHRSQAAAALTSVIAAPPRLLHFHIRYPDNYLMDLALADIARKRGFAGTITCSGSSAALNSGWILERVCGVDGVISHAAVFRGDDRSKIWLMRWPHCITTTGCDTSA